MLRYVARRLAWMIPTLLGITLVVFLAVHAAPGDPEAAALGVDSAVGVDAAAASARFRADHLLDQPIWRQYLHFLGPFDLSPRGHAWFGGSGDRPWHGALVLDLGNEFARSNVSVLGELGRRLLVTLPMALAALFLAYALAIPLAVLSATRRGLALDRSVSFATAILNATPSFWIAFLLVLVFGAGGLDWLPAVGLEDKDARDWGWFARFLDRAAHLVLPIAALTLVNVAYLTRQARSSLLQVLRQDYLRAARARGLSERDVLLRHALPNAALPLVTLLGTLVPALLGGSVIVERIFGIEGVGKYVYDAMLTRDHNVILGTTLVGAVVTMVAILCADLACAVLDPRLRYE